MKKMISLGSVIVISMLLIVGVGVAKESKLIQAIDETFLFYLNDSDIPWYVPMVTIDGRSYVETRSFCEIFNIGVEWEPVGEKIKLKTPKEESIEYDFGLSEEAALKYANAIFQDLFIQDYLDTMNISIANKGEMIKTVMNYMTETIADPDQYYFITCIPKGDGGDGRSFAVIIKKSDGRIIEVTQC